MLKRFFTAAAVVLFAGPLAYAGQTTTADRKNDRKIVREEVKAADDAKDVAKADQKSAEASRKAAKADAKAAKAHAKAVRARVKHHKRHVAPDTTTAKH